MRSKKYKFVSKINHKVSSGHCKVWRGNILNRSQHFYTELEATKWVDMTLIREGKEPVNIYKKV